MKSSIRSLEKYSSSPELHLWIGDSRLRGLLIAVLIILEAHTVGLLALRGYTCEAVFLALFALVLLVRLVRPRARGRVGLAWRGGEWMLLDQTGSRSVCLLGAPVSTPWLVFLKVAEPPGARPVRLWIFRDSVPPVQWRRLLVRSTLESGGNYASRSGRGRSRL